MDTLKTLKAPVMTFRGLCEHGKVRCMMVEPQPGDSPEWIKDFKKEKAKMARWAHTIDYVTVEEARKSDMNCATCDAKKRIAKLSAPPMSVEGSK
jgi:hypothetical protein